MRGVTAVVAVVVWAVLHVLGGAIGLGYAVEFVLKHNGDAL